MSLSEGIGVGSTDTDRPSVKRLNATVGPCPTCGRTEHWFNDIPLRAFCWGTEDKEHPEMSRLADGNTPWIRSEKP